MLSLLNMPVYTCLDAGGPVREEWVGESRVPAPLHNADRYSG